MQLDKAVAGLEKALVGVDVALDKLSPVMQATCEDAMSEEHKVACDRLEALLSAAVAGQSVAADLPEVLREVSRTVCEAAPETKGCEE